VHRRADRAERDRYIQIVDSFRGVGGAGQGGHVPLRNCHAVKFFSEQYKICDSIKLPAYFSGF